MLLRLHTLGPDAQGSWHQDGYPKPAAADNERHEQAEVMHGWDLSVSSTRQNVKDLETFNLCLSYENLRLLRDAFLLIHSGGVIYASCTHPINGYISSLPVIT